MEMIAVNGELFDAHNVPVRRLGAAYRVDGDTDSVGGYALLTDSLKTS